LCDYYVRAKAGYYSMKDYKKSATGYLEKVNGGYKLHVTGILNEEVECQVRVMVLDLKNGSIQEVLQEEIHIYSEKTERFIDLEITQDEILVGEVTAGDQKHRSWYRDGLPKLEKAQNLQWKQTSDGIEVWSDTYIHAVEIEGMEEVEDNYFSLLPGEKRCIRCRCDEGAKVSGYSFRNI